jgi:hypothetical protein
MASKSTAVLTEVPHSWDLAHWPASIYPHTEPRARYLIRANRDALMAEGALTRVGRELVVFGKNYDRWLQRQRGEVTGYECPANLKRGAA